MRSKRKKTLILSCLPLIVLMVLFLFRFDRTSYILNKGIRYVSLRLIQFEHLSFVRREDYKFNFFSDHYDISFFNNRTKRWHSFASHPYSHNITPSIKDLEIVLTRGRINRFLIEGQETDVKSYLILNFHPTNKPSKDRGIIFYTDGNWRVFGPRF
jgi:hypothetical protein